MIEIFTVEQEAIDYAQNIHDFLTKNRQGYNAERWCMPSKSEIADEWAVKTPPDYLKLNLKIVEVDERLSIPITSVRSFNKYPTDWRNIEAIDITPIGKDLKI